MSDPSAYWSTVAGVCIGLGIALAVEVGAIRAMFKGTPWWLRLIAGTPIVAAAMTLVVLLQGALSALAQPKVEVSGAPVVNTLLLVIASVMIGSRIIDAVTPSLPVPRVRRSKNAPDSND